MSDTGEAHTGFGLCVCVCVFVCRPEVKRTLGRPRRSLENKVKMHLQQVGWGHELDSSGSGQGQVAGACAYGDEPSGSIKFREFLDYLGNS